MFELEDLKQKTLDMSKALNNNNNNTNHKFYPKLIKTKTTKTRKNNIKKKLINAINLQSWFSLII